MAIGKLVGRFEDYAQFWSHLNQEDIFKITNKLHHSAFTWKSINELCRSCKRPITVRQTMYQTIEAYMPISLRRENIKTKLFRFPVLLLVTNDSLLNLQTLGTVDCWHYFISSDKYKISSNIKSCRPTLTCSLLKTDFSIQIMSFPKYKWRKTQGVRKVPEHIDISVVDWDINVTSTNSVIILLWFY